MSAFKALLTPEVWEYCTPQPLLEFRMERLKCATHCSRMACIDHPTSCPECGKSVPQDIFPIFLPYPLCNAHKLKSCIVMKPTSSNWNECFKPGQDFHIGVCCRESGIVFSYLRQGVVRESTGWENSLLVLSCTKQIQLELVWDETLQELGSLASWCDYRYHEHRHNCFDFLLSFLEALSENASNKFNYSKKLAFQWSAWRDIEQAKTDLVDNVIAPRLAIVENYSNLVEKVKIQGSVSIGSSSQRLTEVFEPFKLPKE